MLQTIGLDYPIRLIAARIGCLTSRLRSEVVRIVVELYDNWNKPAEAAEWRKKLRADNPVSPEDLPPDNTPTD